MGRVVVAPVPGAGRGRPMEDQVNALTLTLTFDGHRVRMAGTPERPEWIAKDVCRVLDIHNTARALANAGVTDDEKGVHRVNTPGGPQDVTTITQPAVWKLVLISRKPGALRFKEWLANDVLPSLAAHGCYPPPTTIVPSTREHQIATALLLAHEVITEKNALIAELTPKAEGFDRLSSAEGLLNLQEAGKALGLGANRLQWRLIDDGILFRGRHGKAEPKQEHVEAGRFVLRVREVDGQQYVQTLCTPRGLTWLAERYPAEPIRHSAGLALTEH
jgi:anti-repressor protein